MELLIPAKLITDGFEVTKRNGAKKYVLQRNIEINNLQDYRIHGEGVLLV